MKAFEAQFGTGAIPNGPAMSTYDAVMIVAQALKEGATKENLAQWCKNMDNLHPGKTFTANNLIAGNGITFDENGDLANPKYTVIKVNSDGKFYSEGTVDMTGF